MNSCSEDREPRVRELAEPPAPTMPRPVLPAVEARADWLAGEFDGPLERVRSALASWPAPKPEVDPVLLEYQRRAAFGLCEPVAPNSGDDKVQT